MSYPFDLVVALGSSQTGLTLTASVRDTAGTALGSQPAYTVVEHGGGWYSYHTSAMPDGQRGVVRLLSGATVMAVGVVTPIETENADAKSSAIKAKTDLIPSDPADASDLAASFATVNTKLDTIDDLVDTEVAAIKADTAAIKAKTDGLPASPAAVGDIPTAAAVADAVWDELQSGHATAGTFGEYLDAAASAVPAAVWAAAPEGPTLEEFAVAVRDVDNMTPAASSVGAAINSAAAAGDPWSAPLPGSYGAGTAGRIVGDNLNAAITSRMATFTYTAPPTADAVVAAWKADAEVITLLATGAALDLMIVDDGAGAYEFTAGALANAPASGTAPTVAQIRTEMDANSTKLAAIVADTNELQTDWADGGRLDLLLDAAAAGGGAGEVTPESIGAALDAYMIEDGLGLRGAICSILATTTGVGPGLVEGVATWKDPSGAATRVAGTVTAAGRTTVTLTPYEP